MLPALLALATSLSSCYHVEERQKVDKNAIPQEREVKVATKVHLVDGSVILYREGFLFARDTIRGTGKRYSIAREEDPDELSWLVPIDSVVGLEYYKYGLKGGREFGSFLLGTTVTAEIGMATIVLLKAIFGSCPTVYTMSDTGATLECECFSYSIGRMFEQSDLDRLSLNSTKAGSVRVRVKNEALETHYIDMFRLVYADHPYGTELFPDDDGNVIRTSNLKPSTTAMNSEGRDVLGDVVGREGNAYTSDSATVRRMLSEHLTDWIEFKIPRPHGSSSLTIAIRMRNSLQNTVLLYDLMMRNQGLNVLEWSETIDKNPWYAWKLARWYRSFSGIQIQVLEEHEYRTRAWVKDTGPIAWRSLAVMVPIAGDDDTIHVRLSFLPDNIMLDWVAFDFDGERVKTQTMECIDVRDHTGAHSDDAMRSLRDDDERYCVTYPGEWLDLTFNVPQASTMNRSYFILSNGYYVEWVRPAWVKENGDVPGFDLDNREQNRKKLAELWMAKKPAFERQFFSSRVPVREEEAGR
jgi:hypothetical protein